MYQRVIARAGRYSAITGRSYSSRRLSTSRATKIAGGVFVGGFLLISLILPALVLLWASLQRYYAAPSWSAFQHVTPAAYSSLVSDNAAREALKNTIVMAVTAGLATMVLATAVSWIVVRVRSRVSKVADFVAFMPHMLPSVVLAFVVLIIYLYVPIPLYATLWIIVVGLITRSISIATRQMNSGIGLIDRELEEAAATCGANPFYSFRRVTLPLLLPSFGSGFALVALLSLTNLAFPLALQSQGNLVWASLIWTNWTIGYVPSTAALSLVLMLVAIGLSFMARRLSFRRGRAAPESVTM
jgi:iron(III) transport system permease protein